MRRPRQLYVEDPGPNPEPIPNLAWDYGEEEVDAHQVAREINGGAPGDRHTFIMKPEGHARIFGTGPADGPFPEHYEPWESPVTNMLHPDQGISPAFKIWDSEMDPQGDVTRYPLVGTTYRVSEHWQTGAMTRNLAWLRCSRTCILR